MGSVNFDELYGRYADDLRKTIRRIVKQADGAEDILQEVFIRAWNRRKTLSEIQNLRKWLTRIAVNLSINALRSRNRKKELLLGDRASDEEDYLIQKALVDFATPGPESELIRNSRRDTVRRIIAELPAEKREVLELVDQGDLTIRETSERLRIPDGTVKSRLYYGRKILSERIRDLLDE